MPRAPGLSREDVGQALALQAPGEKRHGEEPAARYRDAIKCDGLRDQACCARGAKIDARRN